MGTRTVALFDPVQPGTSSAAQFTSPSGVRSTISKLSFCNASASSCWVSVWLVPSGSTAIDATKITDEQAVLPGETWVDIGTIGQTLEPGASIHLAAQTAAAVTAHCSGYQQAG